jgi:hypothetical protein
MAEATTKPKPAVTSSANHHQRDAAVEGMVDKASELSDELLVSLEKGEWGAIEAVGRFVVTVEEALPQEVAGTSEVAKRITLSGLEMTDQLIHTQYEVLRKVIDSTAKALAAVTEPTYR